MAKTSQEQRQAKVKTSLHLRLTNEDWVETFKTLTRAELGVFYWIRTKDPYGDRELDINCGDLAKELVIHKSSVSRALQSLASKLLIELELISVKVKQKISNRRLTLLCKEEAGSNQEQSGEKESVAPVQQQSHQCNSNRTSATAIAPVQQQSHQCNDQPSEPFPDKSSKIPQTYTDYSDSFKTTTDTDVVVLKENVEENSQPTKEEIKEALAEVRRLSPDIQINIVVQKAVLNYWTNFPAAVQHVKKAVRENWKCNLTGLLIKSLKDLPEEAKQAANKPRELPKPTRDQCIELSNLGRRIAIPMIDGAIADGIELSNGEVLPWWKALSIPFDQLE